MNLLIFGAAGKTGRELVQQAIAQGHTVTAFVRHPDKLDIQHANLRVVQGDVTHAEAVQQAVQGQDAVFSALGSSSLKKNPALVEGIRNIVQAMEQHGVKRFVYQSSLGVGDSRDRVNFFVRFIVLPFVLKNAIEDHAEKERIIQQSSLDWVIVRPAGLTTGPYTKDYKHGESIQFGMKISRADVADFMLNQMSDRTYVHKTPGVSY
ncbi:NAD(P)-dependent oxidoreductase [Leptolyngbya sp. AN02str]|uniref:NAD(P)-dependent oxidoreductase n=1 Tax=Leptolyngbya sp. AN02str TaxID=3423363 RepID=UPI003D320076